MRSNIEHYKKIRRSIFEPYQPLFIVGLWLSQNLILMGSFLMIHKNKVLYDSAKGQTNFYSEVATDVSLHETAGDIVFCNPSAGFKSRKIFCALIFLCVPAGVPGSFNTSNRTGFFNI